MTRILITDPMQLESVHFPDVEVDDCSGIAREDLVEIIGRYDAVITRSRTRLDEALLERATKLRVIGRGGVGVDNIDIEAASRRGILVLNAPEANNISAAELAIALMLSAARGVSRSDRLIRDGMWDRKFLGRELEGAHLGIVGLGRIGSLVSRRAQGLGMHVMAYDPYISRHRAEVLKVELYDELETMLEQSEFLTVHTPLTEETTALIGREELARMPAGAIVVNAARGGIIDEEALLEALESGRLFAAGLDVYVHEPPTIDNPLLQNEKVVLTAHLGANTIQAQARVGVDILERTIKALNGDYSAGIVNAPTFDPEVTRLLGLHLKLGEALGTMAEQLAVGRIQELEIEFSGTFPLDPDPVAIAVAKGFLEPILNEPPNYINAPALLKERDIRVSKVMASRSRGYTNHVMVTASSSKGRSRVGGTVLGDDPRIVSIDGFSIEIRPEGTMLICTNYDRPGAVGRVGTVLGDAGININSMQLSRVEEDKTAMFAVTLDQTPSEEVLQTLKDLGDVIQALRIVHFRSDVS
ncbi:MAG: phosphoglycerate dehydrogenase [Trueperaceae bacterium]|nr:MAG: phosphoglycerate dehydrogenase [Trueperaceae bacterium]